MNRAERDQIRQMVLACRRLLEGEFDQLLRLHGSMPDRRVDPPPERRRLRQALDEGLSRESQEYPTARRRYIKHAAFTFLNRLIALRVAEANGLITETVLPRSEYADRSRRERDLADRDSGLAVQPESLTQEALSEAFNEMRTYIPLLFRENDPYALLLPRLPAYREMRGRLVQLPEALWREFETLGWTYQYFNSEEREEIRRRLRRNPTPDDVPALNQFYTVGWIVRALVHNTLGRLWLEAYPQSRLRDQLSYLVPIRNHLQPPGHMPAVEEIRVLDPACGSGHFLLGTFDLLLEIWQEARPDLPLWRIPALILEHNLFGVDIDLRAAQIAAMALYLKARTVYERLKGDDPEAHFALRRLNIVCGDIRFTDGERYERLLAEFGDDPSLQSIIVETLDACRNAFVIGSLLRIQQPFERLFAQRTAKLEALRQKSEQLSLPVEYVQSAAQVSLGDVPLPVPKPLTVEEIVAHIRAFIRESTETHDMGSMLFGLDAEQAVHLVDILTERYDVVLMNPPYGAMPAKCKEYAREHYPRTHNDYYAAFIERAVDLCEPGGLVGALTGRTFMFLKSFQKLREEILRQDALPEAVLDLGFNVLDEATARYAASVLRRRLEDDGVNWDEHPVVFFRLTDWEWDEKRTAFERTLASHETQNVPSR